MNTCVFKRFSSYLMATGLWGFFISPEIVLWLIFKRYLSISSIFKIYWYSNVNIYYYYLISAASIIMSPSFISGTGYLCFLSFFNNFYLFIFLFGSAGSVAVQAVLQLQCKGFSLWWLLLQSTGSRGCGFSSCGAWACLPGDMWNLLGSGTKLVFFSLAGGFLTPGPSGKF